MTEKPVVSIIIKALNEQERIGAAIESALSAVEPHGGEVILADSCSTDDTIAIAKRYPITIVQLKNPTERRCGIGPQLGYQIARGEFVYILDGDMEMDADFLGQAIRAMRDNKRLGGVAGLIDEQSEASYQFRGRKRRRRESTPGKVRWLDMGGLYRRQALDEVGHFSNRNLHAYEEMDLGLRLNSAGWELERIPVRSVLHYGYEIGNWALLKRRWKSRYLDGAGEALRAAIGKPWFKAVALSQKHLFIGLGIWAGLLAGLVLLPVTSVVLSLTLMAMLLLILYRAIRSGNIGDAAFGQVVWQITSLAMLRGFVATPVDPQAPIEHVIIHTP